MNKTIIAIVVVAVVVIGGFFLLKGSQPSSNTTSTAPTNNTGTSRPPVSGTQSGQTAPQESATVVYGTAGFSPPTVRVKAGAVVTFKNESSNQMWVASNPHPVHTGYSGFDARQAYGSGESYSFTFTRVGTWGYHNHLNPSDTGTIVVE